MGIFLLAGGCGYHFTGEGAGPKPGLRLIAIPVFENETSEPDLGSLFAGALRQEFLQKGPMQVVPSENADAVFWGRITDIYTTSVAHREFDTRFDTRVTLETRLYVTLDIRCQDVKTGTVLWQDPRFTYYRVYRQSSDPENPDPIVGYESRRSALAFLAREMAVRIHDRFLSNF